MKQLKLYYPLKLKEHKRAIEFVPVTYLKMHNMQINEVTWISSVRTYPVLNKRGYPFPVFLLFLLLFLNPHLLISQANWEMKKEEDGIKAYIREMEDSKYVEYKVEAVIEADLASLVSILHDSTAYFRIFEDSKEVEFKKREGDTVIYAYILTGAPFPVRDRAGTYKNTFSYLPQENLIRLDIDCVNEFYDPRRRTIQITDCSGFWEFRDTGDGNVTIIHQFHADPGGMVPPFLVNDKTIDGPVYTIKKMKELLQSGDYQKRIFRFMEG